MGLTPVLRTPRARRSFIRSVISAFERDDPIGSAVAVDEDGLGTAAFTDKPGRRLYYVERVAPDADTGVRCLVVRPNRSRHLTQDPLELARGTAYELRVSPHAAVYALPTETIGPLRDLRAVRRQALEQVGRGTRPLLTYQVWSHRQLDRLYRRMFVDPTADESRTDEGGQ